MKHGYYGCFVFLKPALSHMRLKTCQEQVTEVFWLCTVFLGIDDHKIDETYAQLLRILFSTATAVNLLTTTSSICWMFISRRIPWYYSRRTLKESEPPVASPSTFKMQQLQLLASIFNLWTISLLHKTRARRRHFSKILSLTSAPSARPQSPSTGKTAPMQAAWSCGVGHATCEIDTRFQ